MKRAELKRGIKGLKSGEGPKRKTPMPRGNGFAGGKALDRRTSMPFGHSGEVRRAAAKKSKSRPATAPKPVIDLVKERSGGFCEVGLVCLGNAVATETAHRRGKQAGGVGRKNATSNSAGNLARACHDDHKLIDEKDIPGATRLGLKVLHSVAHPHEMPVYLYSHNGWVLLDDFGGMRTAPRTAWDRPDGPLPVIQIRDADDDIDQEVPQAVARWGHRDCGGWTSEIGDVCRCACETDLFVVCEVAS